MDMTSMVVRSRLSTIAAVSTRGAAPAPAAEGPAPDPGVDRGQGRAAVNLPALDREAASLAHAPAASPPRDLEAAPATRSQPHAPRSAPHDPRSAPNLDPNSRIYMSALSL